MKMKNNSAITGLILAFANLGAVTAQATQLATRTQCQPFTIQISVEPDTYANPTNDLEKQLSDEASSRCYGHPFVIDRSSIERRQVRRPNTGFDPQYAVLVFANVSCMN
jgi:hypothetical protein